MQLTQQTSESEASGGITENAPHEHSEERSAIRAFFNQQWTPSICFLRTSRESFGGAGPGTANGREQQRVYPDILGVNKLDRVNRRIGKWEGCTKK